MEQRSAEWFAARLGKVTASRVSDVTARTRSGWGASRAKYAAQLVVERLTGVKAAEFVSPAMQWGTDQEPLARDAYRHTRPDDVIETGFIDHPTIPASGASPDGMVGKEGLVELKCPDTATHIETLLGEPIPLRYHLQMQWQLACTGREWCDFVSYDPRMPERLQLYIQRVPRDVAVISSLEHDVALFLREVEAKVAALESYGR